MVVLLHFGESVIYGSIAVEPIELSCCISSDSSGQVSGRTCLRSIQISYSHHTFLQGGILVSTVLNMLEDIPYLCPMIENHIRYVLVD